MVRGVLVMVPCGLLLIALQWTVAPALVVLAVFIAAFEFSIVSTIPIGAELSPGTPGRGIGTLMAAGTVGRMLVAIPATRLYQSVGFGAPALLAVVAATVAGVAMTARDRLKQPR